MVATARVREAARRDLRALVHRGLDVPNFVRAATRVLRRAVPCEGTCLLTIDPATMLPTSEVADDGLPLDVLARLTEIELREPDFNKFTDLARAPRPAATLSEATAGELDRSIRQRELRRPSGFADELRAALPGATGVWGAVTLLRETGRPYFSAAEARFVASVVDELGDGLRRAMLFGGDRRDVAVRAGVVVLAADDSVETADEAGDRWLAELSAAGGPSLLPQAIRAVAVRARAIARGDDVGRSPAELRSRTGAGHWVIVRGSVLGDGPEAGVAILLEAAGPAEMAPLIAEAYGLTERERSVTELVAQGLSTSEIAARLHLSSYTVQDHLKSVFGKCGVATRGDLVARLFFDHYRPRLTSSRAVT